MLLRHSVGWLTLKDRLELNFIFFMFFVFLKSSNLIFEQTNHFSSGLRPRLTPCPLHLEPALQAGPGPRHQADAQTANMSGGPLTLREPDNEASPVPTSVVHLAHAKLRNERGLNYV